MKNLIDLETSAIALPLPEREQLFATLDASITEEHETIAVQTLAEDLRVVEERFALIDAGKMATKDWDEAMKGLFGNYGESR